MRSNPIFVAIALSLLTSCLVEPQHADDWTGGGSDSGRDVGQDASGDRDFAGSDMTGATDMATDMRQDQPDLPARDMSADLSADMDIDLAADMGGDAGCIPEADPVGDGMDTSCDGIDGVLGQVVLVDPTSGNDSANGMTTATPVRSLGIGIQIALRDDIGTVLVKSGAQNSPLRLIGNNIDIPLEIIGGYTDWISTAGTTSITPGNTEVAFEIIGNLNATVSFRNFEFNAPQQTLGDAYTTVLLNATGPNPVTLRDCVIRSNTTAANGTNGVDYTTRARASSGADGGQGACTTTTNGGGGGAQGICAVSSPIKGGNGGGGAAGGSAGHNACTGGSPVPGGNGSPGASANDGSTAPATTASPQFVGGEWQMPSASPGVSGADGGGGGGGGGGGATGAPGGKGGNGGAGGCGGEGGGAGAPGISSIGLVVYFGAVVVNNTTIYRGTAGNGGTGGAGACGQTGGLKQNGFDSASLGGDGANGGNGGDGGNGAGGDGGWSIAVLKTAGAVSGNPTLMGTATAGTGGAAATGGCNGMPQGPAGRAGSTHGQLTVSSSGFPQ